MKRMRFLVAILIIWLFLFYNIERLSEPIDLTKAAYTFVPLVAALTIVVPPLRKVPLWGLLLVPIPIFLMLKVAIGLPVLGTTLPLTVTEVCAIAVTITLARLVSNGVGEFESAVAHITIGRADTLPEPFSTGQSHMYRELKRARHYQRPLTLMAIGVEEESIQVALDRMVREAQQAMMKRYVLSDVARVLCNNLEDYNIIAQNNNHFLILLPEVTTEQLPSLAGGLCQVVSEQVGVNLKIGIASFPEDAMTFDGLVKRAVGEMQEDQELAQSLQPQSLTTKHRTSVAE